MKLKNSIPLAAIFYQLAANQSAVDAMRGARRPPRDPGRAKAAQRKIAAAEAKRARKRAQRLALRVKK